MFNSFMKKIAPLVLTLNLISCAPLQPAATPRMEVGDVQVNPDIRLRRLVFSPANPKGTVLFLHGFPESLYAWKGVAETLASDYEVHAFDWPGYGQSSRPNAQRFSYSPRDYAQILKDYIRTSGIDTSRLVIYATDIGGLPAILAALEQPNIAMKIIVGDFAPFNRPQYMADSLQSLKSKPSSDITHAAMNKNRDEILENAFRRGLPKEEQFELSPEFKADIAQGWGNGEITSADAFYYYYSYFTRDQDYFEANMAKLNTPVTVVWGEKDFYIKKEMGIEFADRIRSKIKILPKLGHYPHLQNPAQTVDEIRSAFVP